MEEITANKEMKINAVDKFLDDLDRYGKSDVKCPFCGTPLKYYEYANGMSYEIRCQTPNCLRSCCRGI